jgi:hypothetical protein
MDDYKIKKEYVFKKSLELRVIEWKIYQK